ncbi:MAG: hypothetical protein GC201_04175 [Alphaproteobacteria bacterium]|nr:hypothetical protein [Alphaproteobacteria bacterium]
MSAGIQAQTEPHPAAPPETAAVDIVAVDTSKLREEFIRVPWSLYGNDPSWVPPLLANERDRLGHVEQLEFHGMRRRFWLARMEGRAVGRISAQIRPQTGPDATGHFGWIEAIDSHAVFAALFAAAETWLAEQGAVRSMGPFNSSINEECGVLVDGFDTPPMIMMPHSPPYYGPRIEQLGYRKEMDLLAFKIDVEKPLPARLEKLKSWVTADPAVRLRMPDYRRFEDEIRTVLDLFNDAWSGNWGFEPFSESEIGDLARSLKPLLPPQAVCIAEHEGRPVAFALGLPNLNEMARDLNGRLLPFGWAKLLFRIKTGRFTSGRLALMGVRKEFQSTPMGAALAISVIERLRGACLEHGVYNVELSWVLETNRRVRSIIEAFGADAYKKYRLYSHQIA